MININSRLFHLKGIRYILSKMSMVTSLCVALGIFACFGCNASGNQTVDEPSKKELITSASEEDTQEDTTLALISSKDMREYALNQGLTDDLHQWQVDYIYYKRFATNEVTDKYNLEFVFDALDFIDENELPVEAEHEPTKERIRLCKYTALCDIRETKLYANDISYVLETDRTDVDTVLYVRDCDKLTIEEYISAIYELKEACQMVDDYLLDNIKMAHLFADSDEYNKKRSKAELSELFGVSESVLTGVFIMKGYKQASIKEMIDLLNSTSLIKNNLPEDLQESLYMVEYLTDANEYQKKRSASQVADLLMVNQTLIDKLGRDTISISELMDIMDRLPDIERACTCYNEKTFDYAQKMLTCTKEEYNYEEIEALLSSIDIKLTLEEIKLILMIYNSIGKEYDLMTYEEFVTLFMNLK